VTDLQFPTSLGISTPDTITLLGRDLPSQLLGKISFGELAYQLITLRPPSRGQAHVFEAVLVALADHGFTPTAIAARLTYLSAPDAIQGALAAGLLGGGSRFLGVSEDTGEFLAETLATVDTLPVDDPGWDALATAAVEGRRDAGAYVPGLGHHLHKSGDPRTAVIIEIAREEGQYGPHLALFEAVAVLPLDIADLTLIDPLGPHHAAIAMLGADGRAAATVAAVLESERLALALPH